mmetsp:Transcript_7801/g.21752  ORF Transcript_7801/g.21752 Transcript_7801/m.21752 type:complete len:130 (+) Transcript_7801:2968-3357(+)
MLLLQAGQEDRMIMRWVAVVEVAEGADEVAINTMGEEGVIIIITTLTEEVDMETIIKDVGEEEGMAIPTTADESLPTIMPQGPRLFLPTPKLPRNKMVPTRNPDSPIIHPVIVALDSLSLEREEHPLLL